MKLNYINYLFITNLNKIFVYYELLSIDSQASRIEINSSTLKSWLSYERTPTLKTIDKIANHLDIPTFILFMNDLKSQELSGFLNPSIENNTPEKLDRNLMNYYKTHNLNSWEERASKFYGVVSIDTLKSYHRKKNQLVPPIKKLEILSTYLGLSVVEIIS